MRAAVDTCAGYVRRVTHNEIADASCPGCHPERSEGSVRPARQTFRCAQGDSQSLQITPGNADRRRIQSSCFNPHIARSSTAHPVDGTITGSVLTKDQLFALKILWRYTDM